MSNSKQTQLQEIRDNVTDLTRNLDSLRLNIRRLEQEIASDSPSETFVIGDTLQITNNYLGLRGTQGKVIYTTAKQCTIRDSSKKQHTQSRTNFKLVHHAAG